MASLWTGENTSFFTGPLAKPLISSYARWTGVMEQVKLAGFHRVDMKTGKQARKNKPRPEMSRWWVNLELRKTQSKG